MNPTTPPCASSAPPAEPAPLPAAHGSVRRTRWTVMIAVLALLAAGGRIVNRPVHAADGSSTAASAAGPGGPASAASAPPVQVTTVRVQRQDVPIYRSGIGTVTALASVTVKAQTDGLLERIGYVEGQDVKAGQLLVQLDPRALRAQLAQARATQARDEAQLVNARVDLTRYERLITDDAATQQQLDTQKSLVAQLAATVQTDAAQVQYAQVQLSYATIRAPISGRVGARLVDAGNLVHATDTTGLVVINQIDPITALFTLPEEAVQEINRAQRASHAPLAVDAQARDGSSLLAKGTLVVVNNQIDTTTGTVQLKARFANAAHSLWPGQYINARLLLGQRSQVLTVPQTAVQHSDSGSYVYVVDASGRARTQPVQVAVVQDGTAVIDRGIAVGERVVSMGQYKLKPGAKVVEARPDSAGAGASGAGARGQGGASGAMSAGSAPVASSS